MEVPEIQMESHMEYTILVQKYMKNNFYEKKCNYCVKHMQILCISHSVGMVLDCTQKIFFLCKPYEKHM